MMEVLGGMDFGDKLSKNGPAYPEPAPGARSDTVCAGRALRHQHGLYFSRGKNGTATPSLGVFLSIAEALEATPDYFLVDTPFASKEYLQDGIAKKLRQCSDSSLRVVERLIDALLEEQWGKPSPF